MLHIARDYKITCSFYAVCKSVENLLFYLLNKLEMAELENDVDVQDTNYEEVESNEDNTQETQNTSEQYSKSELRVFKELKIDPENATIEDFKKITKILAKTQDSIIERKSIEKEQKEPTKNISSKEDVKRYLAEEKFYDKNPEAESYRTKIEAWQEKGLSLEDAYLLASKKDKEVDERRGVYGTGLVKGSTNNESVPLISIEEFDRMTPQSQSDYTTKMSTRY
jgi:hypothetical protein